MSPHRKKLWGWIRPKEEGTPTGTIVLVDVDLKRVEKTSDIANSSEMFVKGQLETTTFSKAQQASRHTVKSKTTEEHGTVLSHKRSHRQLFKRDSDASSDDWLILVQWGKHST